MAAGQHNVSRRRHFHSFREENLPFSKNRYSQKSLTRVHDLGGPVYRVSATIIHSSGRSNIQGQKNGFVAGYVTRGHGGVYGGNRPTDAYEPESQAGDNETPVSEVGQRMTSEKKRKFSPVVWDRYDKQVRISSKNRIVKAASVFVQPSVIELGNHSLDAHSVVRAERDSAAAQEYGDVHMSPVELPVETKSDRVSIPISPADVSAASSPKFSENYQEDEQMEDGEYVEERNISKSKWAYLDSPSTSVVAREFNREASEGSRDKSFHSAEVGHFIGSASGDEQSKNETKINDDLDINSDLCLGSSSEDEEDSGRIQEAEGPKHRRFDMLQGCRSVYRYDRLNKISEGTYGVVYKAKDKETGEVVALKKVKMGKESEGFPVSALREINILMSLQHPSIVEVKEVVMDDYDGVYMVMEYVDHELKGLMEVMKQPFSQSDVKCLMIQLLEGLSCLHENWIIHRDLKTSNLLVSSKGELKICDFGLSRQYGRPLKPYTSLVVTLWYRAPELLLGTKQYSTAIDMWSVGCIMAELLAKKPLFDGNKELEQLNKIFGTLGTPDDSIWPGYSRLPGIKGTIVKQPYNHLRKRFPAASFTGAPGLTELGFDLLSRLLAYNPEKRITAEDALNHAWFKEASWLFALLLNVFNEILGYRICRSQV